jgi:hypothetical protein
MPLGSYFTGQWYGEAVGATLGGEANASVAGDIVAWARAGGSSAGVAAIANAKGTRLVNRPATLPGVALITQALPKARARVASTIRVNTLSQDDVTGAVLETEIEPGLSLKQALRLIAAATAGQVAGAGGSTITLRSAGSAHKDRIVATVDGNGNRTAITLDVTD